MNVCGMPLGGPPRSSRPTRLGPRLGPIILIAAWLLGRPDIADAQGREVHGENSVFAGPGVVVGAERQVRAFDLQDVVEAPGHVLERPLEVEPGLLGPPGVAEARGQRVGAGEPAPEAPAHQVPQPALGSLAGQDLLGHRVEKVPGRQVGAQRVLGPVPPRVPDPHRTSVPFDRWKEEAWPVTAAAASLTRT